MLTDDPEEGHPAAATLQLLRGGGHPPLTFDDCGNIYFYFYTTRRQLAERDFDPVRFELQSY